MTGKDRIRADFLAARRALLPKTAREHSRAIVARVCSLPEFAAAQAILTYVASKDNEVETRGLIEALLADARPVWVPLARGSSVLVWSRLLALDELAPGRFGILEPRPECRRILDLPRDAMALVPGIAFSAAGQRIGYGGGYFDRFLSRFTGTAAGLAYECQIAPSWAVDAHDVPVAMVVTERRVLRARPVAGL
ncbi:MAG: 5-formyltetrahydrofolate cyclo-ligase [Candidatus Hydrogenedentes bacterium]|nr:5-formyltetrahydrofolate cyclo-ligase [Candidatus Hydrogenedentota bacterium]